MYVIASKAPLLELLIHLNREAWIAFLFTKKVTIPDKYSDFADVFSVEKALMLPKQTKLNKHIIKLESDKQSLYRLIYSLDQVELKT